jgi:hypothetical protein
MTLAICKNCKYFKPNNSSANKILYGYCTHPSVRTVNIISGETTNKYAEDVRNNEELCGKKGQLYKPEQPHIIHLKLWGKDDYYVVGYIFIVALIVIRGHQVGIGNIELISSICALSYIFFFLRTMSYFPTK